MWNNKINNMNMKVNKRTINNNSYKIIKSINLNNKIRFKIISKFLIK